LSKIPVELEKNSNLSRIKQMERRKVNADVMGEVLKLKKERKKERKEEVVTQSNLQIT
jgi:hypothetical protein